MHDSQALGRHVAPFMSWMCNLQWDKEGAIIILIFHSQSSEQEHPEIRSHLRNKREFRVPNMKLGRWKYQHVCVSVDGHFSSWQVQVLGSFSETFEVRNIQNWFFAVFHFRKVICCLYHIITVLAGTWSSISQLNILIFL